MSKNNLNPLDEKFKKDQMKFKPIKNDDLVCKDCIQKFDDTELPCNTSKCKVFDMKPDEVLSGGDCDEYSEER